MGTPLTDEDGAEIHTDESFIDPSFEYINMVILASDEHECVNNCSPTYDPLQDEKGSALHHVLDLHASEERKGFHSRTNHAHSASRLPMRGFAVSYRAGYRTLDEGDKGESGETS